MPDHIVTAYDKDLLTLSNVLTEMGGLAEAQVRDGVNALVKADPHLAQEVIDRDIKLDQLERSLEEQVIVTIAKRQPMAKDLREIIAALKMASSLERIGDLGKNIAKRAIATQDQITPKAFSRGMNSLSTLAQEQLSNVLEAFTTKNSELAIAVRDRDEDIDAVYTSLFRELLTYMMEDPRNITFCTHLLFCAKNLERIGDHTTNVAEVIYFQVTGEQLDEERQKNDQTSSFSAPTVGV